jgi:hypothetical protein
MRPSPPSMGTSSFLTSESTRAYARSVAMTMSWFERSSGMIFEIVSSVLRSAPLFLLAAPGAGAGAPVFLLPTCWTWKMSASFVAISLAAVLCSVTIQTFSPDAPG